MLSKSTLLLYYKRKEIQEAIVESATGREVAVRFGEEFGKRPDTLRYAKDVLEFVKRGATSFHISEEHWRNIGQLSPLLRKQELDELRTGWDLVLDIDCHFLEYSKIAAELVMGALKGHGIGSVSCKFSGNKGFHIAVPYKAFPAKVNKIETTRLFPEAARRIALYLKYLIQEPLSERVVAMEKGDFNSIVRKTGKTSQEMTRYVKNKWGDKVPALNTESFLNIDTVLISSRHLYRSVYSLHEKSGLASVPVETKNLASFSRDEAKPEIVIANHTFLDDKKADAGEAKGLFTEAFDYQPITGQTVREERKSSELPEKKIPELFFPPCIQNILKGLEDGRKRSVFILLNFLTRAGWDYDDIHALLTEWNKKNANSLREVEILGPMRYHKQHKKRMLPPNCQAAMYYKDIGVCHPDNLCAKIRNPLNYSVLKVRFQERG
jgi:hypothetical protein